MHHTQCWHLFSVQNSQCFLWNIFTESNVFPQATFIAVCYLPVTPGSQNDGTTLSYFGTKPFHRSSNNTGDNICLCRPPGPQKPSSWQFFCIWNGRWNLTVLSEKYIIIIIIIDCLFTFHTFNRIKLFLVTFDVEHLSIYYDWIYVTTWYWHSVKCPDDALTK